jgi:hypothetical protein
MARILKNDGGGVPAGAFGAKKLFVRGLPYDNTAVKFWTCLIDEVLSDYPPETGVALYGLAGGALISQLLSPESILQRDMERLEESDFRKAFEDAMSALQVLGPPAGVRLRLVGRDCASEQDILLDYVDAEVLPFLLVWLLEWANIPDAFWNRERVRGDFAAEDRDRRVLYLVAFELRSRHLSEGLYEREITVKFKARSLDRSGAQRQDAAQGVA